MIRKTKGNASAVDYVLGLRPYFHEQLVPAGWRNACSVLLEAGQFDEATNLALLLPHELTSEENDSHESYFEIAANAAYVAATQQRVDIADTVAANIMRKVPSFAAEIDAEAGFRLLMMCAAANEQRSQWLSWLDRKVTEYCSAIPRGKMCAALVSSLEAVNRMLPVQDRCLGKARKLASAAAT